MTTPNPPFDTEIRPFDDAAIAEAAALIAAGQLVAVPTETVYGLAADATSASAVARIYAAKGRPDFNPLIVHVADAAAAERIARFDPLARTLTDRFWPGPLTLVLPSQPDSPIARIATAGLPSVAIRAPAHPAMRALLAACRRPLAAPSANSSGRISPTRAGHVRASLGGRIPLIIDAGPTRHGLESTILKIEDGRLWLLRPGPITADAIAEAGGIEPAAPTGDAVVAPGQLASHYAPAKPLRLGATEPRPGEWLIGFGTIAGDDTLSDAGDLIEAATRLFDALHAADRAPGTAIAIAPIPAEGLGIAINDRLARAAAPQR